MKFSTLIKTALTTAALLCALNAPAAARQDAGAEAEEAEEQAAPERRVEAAPDVAVSLCLNQGDVTVRGWDRREVRAVASEAGALRLQTAGGAPARRVEVLVSRTSEGEPSYGDCGSVESLEISVPRGATVSLTMRNGHTEISDVAEARVDSFNGDVGLSRVARSAEVSSLSGDVSLRDAAGRVRLRAVSGGVEATNLRQTDDSDVLDVSSTSGDVILSGVNYKQIRGAAISGNVEMRGPLARGGSYEFKTISGDVTLELPADASFKLNASVVADGEIVTDFAVKTGAAAAAGVSPPDMADPPSPPSPPGHDDKHKGKRVRVTPPAPPTQTRLVGSVGAGDADLRVASFSGSLHLKKQ